MRGLLSIAKSTALEILSEPLSLLVMLSALALTVFAPAFHYHQFGDPTRMARDAGLSALFTCGSVIAVFCTIRTFRREIESGTLEMTLAHSVSRTGCFLAKTLGATLAYLAFALVIFGTAMVMFDGAAVGGVLARQTGDVARIWGPCLAGGVSVILLPLVLAAALNRFAQFRFVLSAVTLAVLLGAAGAVAVAFHAGAFALRLVPVTVLTVLPTLVLLAAAAAFSVRLRATAAAAAVGVVFALLLPAVGNYYLADALSGNGTLPWRYVALAAAVTAPGVAAFLVLGIRFINGRDILWTT